MMMLIFEEKIIVMMLHVVSRQDAIKFGLKKYFTGIGCPHGHPSERFDIKHGVQ